MDEIEIIAIEVARLIEEETSYKIGEEKSDPMVPSTEIWDSVSSIGSIFYDTPDIEVFCDTKMKIIGSVHIADPDFFEKILNLVKDLISER